MNFAFLEAGVAWAVNVCIDLMLIFTKFGREGLERDLHPNNLDPRQLRELFDEYATDEQFRGRVDRIFDENNLWPNQPGKTAEDLILRAADWDEFAAAHITQSRTRFATCSPPVLLRLRIGRPDHALGVRRALLDGYPLQADLQLRHLALRRDRHDRGAGGSLRAGRSTSWSTNRASASWCSPIPSRCTAG